MKSVPVKPWSRWMLCVVSLAFLGIGTPAVNCPAATQTIQQERPLRGVTVDGAGKTMNEATVAAGLKDALHVAADNTVAQRGDYGGFGASDGFRITPPEDLCSLVSAADSEQSQEQLLYLKEQMNRVAEGACAAAAPLLHQAVAQLRIPYAIEVLRGDESAATDYLRTHKFTRIEAEFNPLVRSEMAQAGISQTFSDLLRALKVSSEEADYTYDDLHSYITAAALDGMFATLGHEEHAMRTSSAARTTPDIKRIFSR